MRRVLPFVLGVVVGHGLALGGIASPARPPHDGSLSTLGGLARRALAVARLPPGIAPGPAARETTVPLEHGPGVWIARVVVNGARTARFLVDTGSSVIVISPALASEVGIGQPAGPPVELSTLGGRTAGPSGTVASLRVGDVELRDAPVVVHDPGPGVDGILGNSFLAQYRVTVDGDRRQLRLGRPGGD